MAHHRDRKDGERHSFAIIQTKNGRRLFLNNDQVESYRGHPSQIALLGALEAYDLAMACDRFDYEPTDHEIALLALRQRMNDDARAAGDRRQHQTHAARKPRPTRRHPSRDRALELAREIRARKSLISSRNLAKLVLDRLATEGAALPSENALRNWLSEKDRG